MKDPATVLTELGKPFPKSAIKRKQGKFDYVEHQTVTRRLNSVAPEWSFVIRETWFREDLQMTNRSGQPVLTMVVLGELTIPGLGTRSGYGVANLQPGGGEDQYKGAESDALKKAASRFGVALDLYGDDYEADSPVQPNVSVQAPQRPQDAPKPANVGADTNAPKDMRAEALGRTLHGLAEHDFLHALAVKWGFTSFADLPADNRQLALDYLNGKGEPAKLQAFHSFRQGWEEQHKRASLKPQANGLLPGVDQLPNPRPTADHYTDR